MLTLAINSSYFTFVTIYEVTYYGINIPGNKLALISIINLFLTA
jgi:hypothetical protein